MWDIPEYPDLHWQKYALLLNSCVHWPCSQATGQLVVLIAGVAGATAELTLQAAPVKPELHSQ